MMTAVLFQLFLLGGCTQHSKLTKPAVDWFENGQKSLKKALNLSQNEQIAKNIVLFLGDGMGISTITASRIFKGQQLGNTGEETKLNLEKFPYVGLSKTYNEDRQVPDSAGTATAYLCGVKANLGTLGVNSSVNRGDCKSVEANKVNSILQWSLDAGKAAGIVTTTRVTHATPAAAYAHTADRNWESDRDFDSRNETCKNILKDIARQLVEDNSNIKVLLGGGRINFLPNDTPDPGSQEIYKNGRQDGKNLTHEWLQSKPAGSNSFYVWNTKQFNSIDEATTDHLLGLFSPSHMEYELRRHSSNEPSFTDMVRKAISILRRDPNGFFLLAEGGLIDVGHHANMAKLALAEVVEFDNAVGEAKRLLGNDSLIIVTADHSHPFNIVGYARRGNNIFGLAEPLRPEWGATDGLPYATLMYGNGPGPQRPNLSVINTTTIDHKQSSGVPFSYDTHSGEDVSIHATGPMAHLIHGVQEQNYISHVLAYAACIGPSFNRCNFQRRWCSTWSKYKNDLPYMESFISPCFATLNAKLTTFILPLAYFAFIIFVF